MPGLSGSRYVVMFCCLVASAYNSIPTSTRRTSVLRVLDVVKVAHRLALSPQHTMATPIATPCQASMSLLISVMIWTLVSESYKITSCTPDPHPFNPITHPPYHHAIMPRHRHFATRPSSPTHFTPYPVPLISQYHRHRHHHHTRQCFYRAFALRRAVRDRMPR